MNCRSEDAVRIIFANDSLFGFAGASRFDRLRFQRDAGLFAGIVPRVIGMIQPPAFCVPPGPVPGTGTHLQSFLQFAGTLESVGRLFRKALHHDFRKVVRHIDASVFKSRSRETAMSHDKHHGIFADKGRPA